VPLKAEERDVLRDYFDHLVEVRSLNADAWRPWLARIEQSHSNYQEAATYLSYVLPAPQQKLVPPRLVAVAREVVWAMSGLRGLPSKKPVPTPYLAGGAAIALHGGRRPVNDLDFNILARPQLVNFAEADGATILEQLNKLVLPRLREVRQAEAGLRRRFGSSRKVETEFKPFQILGRPVTIGTESWFGVEVSLSLIEPDLARIQPPVRSTQYGLSLLDLTDLYNDKLKTVITRRKSGENSLKKVSQDLFDALMVAEMLARETGTDPDLSQQMLLAELRRRMPGYLHHNLEQVPLHDVPEDDLADRMLERLVRTAQAHVQDGERRNRITSLAHGYALDILRYLDTLSRVGYKPTVLPGEQPQHLEQWFTTWNTGPRYGAPRAAEPGRRPSAKLFPSDAFVPDILAVWPPVEKLTITVDGTNLSRPCRHVLTVLCRVEGGFRALADSHDEVQVFCAFRMTSRHFYNAFLILKKLGLVQDSAEGLAVTDKGLRAYRDAVLAYPLPGSDGQATSGELDEAMDAFDAKLAAFGAELAGFEAALTVFDDEFDQLQQEFDQSRQELDQLAQRFAKWSQDVDALTARITADQGGTTTTDDT
jgi:hypothetical protein